MTCTEREGRAVYKPVKDFPWRKRQLVSGEVSWHPYPRCHDCERQRVAAYRERIGEREIRRRQKRYDQARMERRRAAREDMKRPEWVDKTPFMDFFFAWRDEHRTEFLIELENRQFTTSGGPMNRKGSSFDGAFDAEAFAAYCGITKTRYQSLLRASKPTHESTKLRLDEVEEILRSMKMEHKLKELYPSL